VPSAIKQPAALLYILNKVQGILPPNHRQN
jgi:hypothetical protein